MPNILSLFQVHVDIDMCIDIQGCNESPGGIKLDLKHAKGFQKLRIFHGSLCHGIPFLP